MPQPNPQGSPPHRYPALSILLLLLPRQPQARRARSAREYRYIVRVISVLPFVDLIDAHASFNDTMDGSSVEVAALISDHIKNIRAASATRLRIRKHQALKDLIAKETSALRERLQKTCENLEAEEARALASEVEQINNYGTDLGASGDADMVDIDDDALRNALHVSLFPTLVYSAARRQPCSTEAGTGMAEKAEQSPVQTKSEASAPAMEMARSAASNLETSKRRVAATASPIFPEAQFQFTATQASSSNSGSSLGCIDELPEAGMLTTLPKTNGRERLLTGSLR